MSQLIGGTRNLRVSQTTCGISIKTVRTWSCSLKHTWTTKRKTNITRWGKHVNVRVDSMKIRNRPQYRCFPSDVFDSTDGVYQIEIKYAHLMISSWLMACHGPSCSQGARSMQLEKPKARFVTRKEARAEPRTAVLVRFFGRQTGIWIFGFWTGLLWLLGVW